MNRDTRKKWSYRFWKRVLCRRGGFDPLSTFDCLEIGCGYGHFLACMEAWFPKSRLAGVDMDAGRIEQARARLRNAVVSVADAQSLPFPTESFDVAASFQVIEHLPEPQRFLAEIRRVLRPQGLLLMSTPNPAGLAARRLQDAWQGRHPQHISLAPPSAWNERLAEESLHLLCSGTTGLTGFPMLRRFPLGLLNWGPMYCFGFFPWRQGESYIMVARKSG